jgi:hypothetical protein
MNLGLSCGSSGKTARVVPTSGDRFIQVGAPFPDGKGDKGDTLPHALLLVDKVPIRDRPNGACRLSPVGGRD